MGTAGEPTKREKNCREESERREERPKKNLAPDYALLIEQIIDHFNAVAHLRLCALGHRDHRTTDFSGLDVVKRRDAFRPALFQLLFIACHARSSFKMKQQFSRQESSSQMHAY